MSLKLSTVSDPLSEGFQSPEDFSPKKKYTLGLGSGCGPEPKPKAKIDSEFNSIHFGI